MLLNKFLLALKYSVYTCSGPIHSVNFLLLLVLGGVWEYELLLPQKSVL